MTVIAALRQSQQFNVPQGKKWHQCNAHYDVSIAVQKLIDIHCTRERVCKLDGVN